MPSPAERHGRRHRPAITVLLVAALFGSLAACGDDDADETRPVVEVFGPVVGEEGAALATVLRDASEDAAVELRYIGVTSYNEQLDDRLARGDRPGIALISQPGLLDSLAERGVLQPLPADTAATVADAFPPRLVELVARDAVARAVPVTIDVKSLVWYRPDEFTTRGLSVPASLDELTDLSEQIRTNDDGTAPWCVMMEAGSSTGWVGTDWVEDYVLRRLGPDDYQRWAEGGLAFDSPEITGVFDELDALLRRPGAIGGGARAALTVPWEQTATLLLDGGPSCLMAHQADFLRRQFPTDTTIGPSGTVDFFQLPAASSTTAAPLIVGAMLAVGLDDTDGVAAGLELLAGADVAERLNRTGEFLSPRVDASGADDPMLDRLLGIVGSAGDIEFDGSDLMAPAVGSGTFWAGMNAFFAGEDLATILPAIQAGWPDPQGGT